LRLSFMKNLSTTLHENLKDILVVEVCGFAREFFSLMRREERKQKMNEQTALPWEKEKNENNL